MARGRAPDLHDEFTADGLVLGGGGFQRVGDDGAGEQIAGEFDLHSCGGPVVIAVGGKVLRIGVGHDMAAGVLKDETSDRGALQHLGGWPGDARGHGKWRGSGVGANIEGSGR